MANNLIKRVIVSIDPSGYKAIVWELDSKKVVANTPRVTVQFGRGLDEWETLNTTPITNEYYYIDSVKRHYSVKNDGYYRVIVRMEP
jgi:hypothetical protein